MKTCSREGGLAPALPPQSNLDIADVNHYDAALHKSKPTVK